MSGDIFTAMEKISLQKHYHWWRQCLYLAHSDNFVWWLLSFTTSCFLRLKGDVREEVAEKGWWCLKHLSCLEQKLLLEVAVPQHPWLLWGPACGIKGWVKSCGSSARRQLWEIEQWWSAPPKIGLCRPFFFPLLSWYSSSLEVVILKISGVYSVFLFSSYCTVSHLPVSPQFWCFTFWICWIQAQCFEWFHWPCRSACQHRYISFKVYFYLC